MSSSSGKESVLPQFSTDLVKDDSTNADSLAMSPVSPAVDQTGKSSSVFSVDLKRLQLLVDPKNKKLLTEEFGGVEGLCKLFHVDPSIGLSPEEKFATIPEPAVSEFNASESSWLLKRSQPEVPYDPTVFLERSAYFGHNALPPVRQRSLFEYMWMAMQDKILILLTCAALASLAVGLYEDLGTKSGSGLEWVEGVAIIIAISIVVLVQSINDFQKEKQFRALNAKKEQRKVKALRAGQVTQISIYNIQVGDVLLLEPGDLINVDGVLLQAHNLKIDESSATGESDLIKKQAYSKEEDCKDPFIIGGGKVNEGVGRFLVTSVGVNSYFGKTMLGLRVESGDTPLQVKLDHLADSIAGLGIFAAILLFVTLVTKYLITMSVAGWDKTTPEKIGSMFIHIIIETIIIIVVAVPEGLPLAVTLALAYATRRMTKDNNLVRVLASCETMGGATTICSDKTGTLTQNEMTVVAGLVGHRLEFKEVPAIAKLKERLEITTDLKLDDLKFSPAANSKQMDKQEFLHVLVDGLAMNSSAFEEKDQTGKFILVGNKTECALLGFGKRLGLENIQRLRDDSAKDVLQVYPFSSERKSMSTAVKRPSNNGPVYRVYTKGASEIVLKFCSSFMEYNMKTGKFETKTISSEVNTEIRAVIGQYADLALRTICVAFCDYTKSELVNVIGDFEHSDGTFKDVGEEQSKKLEEDFHQKSTLLAIFGIEDPLRDGVSEAVAKSQKAGVFVRMVTGDNLRTAKAIATKCGIYMKGGVAMEGSRFRTLTDEQMTAIVPKLQVLARSSPTDKQILVKKLKDMGETVAVTGDGTNDGPALKMADVGFSMGIAGTEVAKEASSIVLMDDNFSSIIKAMMWGRSVNDSVKKFLQFQLTVNISAVFLSFITAVASSENTSILTAVQLLWINLIMDTLAALALATDPPTEELLERYPQGKRSPLITVEMWKMILGQAVFQVIAGLAVFYLGDSLIPVGWPESRGYTRRQTLGTFVFNMFVFFQLFNEVNCRRIDSNLNIFIGIHRNTFFQVIMVLVLIAQAMIIEYGGVVFSCYGLPASLWGYSILFAALTLPIGVAIRFIPNWDGCTICGVGVAIPDNYRVFLTKERLAWQDSIGKVRTQISVFKALRGTTRPGTSTGKSAEELQLKEQKALATNLAASMQNMQTVREEADSPDLDSESHTSQAHIREQLK